MSRATALLSLLDQALQLDERSSHNTVESDQGRQHLKSIVRLLPLKRDAVKIFKTEHWHLHRKKNKDVTKWKQQELLFTTTGTKTCSSFEGIVDPPLEPSEGTNHNDTSGKTTRQ